MSDILRLTPTSASSTAVAGAFNSLAGPVPEIIPRDQAMAELEATLPEDQGDEQIIAGIYQADLTATGESMAVLTAADPNQSIVIDTERLLNDSLDSEPLLNDSPVELGSPTVVFDQEISAESSNVAESAEPSGAELQETSLDVALESQTLDSANVDVMPDPSLSPEDNVMSTTDVKESPKIGVHENNGIETTDVMA